MIEFTTPEEVKILSLAVRMLRLGIKSPGPLPPVTDAIAAVMQERLDRELLVFIREGKLK